MSTRRALAAPKAVLARTHPVRPPGSAMMRNRAYVSYPSASAPVFASPSELQVTRRRYAPSICAYIPSLACAAPPMAASQAPTMPCDLFVLKPAMPTPHARGCDRRSRIRTRPLRDTVLTLIQCGAPEASGTAGAQVRGTAPNAVSHSAQLLYSRLFSSFSALLPLSFLTPSLWIGVATERELRSTHIRTRAIMQRLCRRLDVASTSPLRNPSAQSLPATPARTVKHACS
ncbi:hypothetical protein DFH06DRAFT_749624 [Mycena polygramma]|nr:hypothetical protein DFH06DRAFT_749624 [Mycena polygramma]